MNVILRRRRRGRRSFLALESCEARIMMATAPPLGAAASFAILGGTTVTNTGATNIIGDVGVSPGTSITGFPPGIVGGGALHAGDASATQAEADLATAYAELASEPVDTSLSGQDLGGLTLTPGVYHYTGAAQLDGTLTLDAQGDPNAVFVIQVGTALTTASDASVTLIGGAHARNVFWQVGSSATIGPGSTFRGNILAFTSITLDSGANIAPGRALAINGAVTMDTNSASSVFTTPLTITADDQAKVYGAALPPLTASYSGFIDGDTAASLATPPTLTTTATAASPVGGYAISAGGAVDPDYTITYAAGTLDVTPAPLTITADDQAKVYGAALPPLTASYSGFVAGDTAASLATPPTLTTTATAASPAGGYAISAGGAVDPDYTITYAAGTLTVGPTISGTVYLDLNASGVLDAGEPGLAGRVVFLDLNHDGKFDPGDPTATTDAGGHFTLANNATGPVSVLEATDQDANNRYVVDQARNEADGTVSIGVVPISPIAPVKVVPDPFSASPSSDPDTAYVQTLYRAVLGRIGGPSEVTFWVTRMNSGAAQQDVAGGFINSPEHRTDEVNSYYAEFLHRAPDPLSAVWVDDLLSGVSEEQVAGDILDSSEYQAAHQDSTEFLQSLYLDVLGRQGEPAGVAFWQEQLASGASRQMVVAGFVGSPEAVDQVVDSFYASYLHRQREEPTSDVWADLLTGGDSASAVGVGILSSAEYVRDSQQG